MSEAKSDESELNALLCGCGRQIRYSHFKNGVEVGSCNKHIVCPTYDELSENLRIANNKLSKYQKAINDIDDYFEYAMDSKTDQKKVHQILGNLTDALAT
jgi:hypothetical protein